MIFYYARVLYKEVITISVRSDAYLAYYVNTMRFTTMDGRLQRGTLISSHVPSLIPSHFETDETNQPITL